MGTVIGPFDADEWFTMGALRKDINFMKANDQSKYALPIQIEEAKLRDYYRKEVA